MEKIDENDPTNEARRNSQERSVENFAMEFQRFGSRFLNSAASFITPRKTLQQFLDHGFTGETFDDFDRQLQMKQEDVICILHFNDVYNIEPSEDGFGGISRFINALRQYHPNNPLILFSGDAFNPSALSTHTRGRHMIPFLNMTKIHTACLGNHDFDFGLDHLEYLTGSTTFPWVLSNVFDAYNPDRPLAGASLYRVFEWQGHRVGIIGLVEKEWLDTLPELDEDDVIYKDFVQQANELSRHLRAKECDLIIALTHMRAPNDEILARESEDIDLILGGHDHDYYGLQSINNTVVGKSGTDFREFSCITIYPKCSATTNYPPEMISPPADLSSPKLLVADVRGKGALRMPNFCGGSVLEWECVEVHPDKVPTNRHVDRLVTKYVGELGKQMDRILGETAVNLETRFSVIRTQETNVGNWLTDLMRSATKTDVAFLNSGTVRSDRVFPPGLFRIRDLISMLPMLDPLVVLSLTGSQLSDVLENSVSQYPKTEGRFLQVSGLKFSFNPNYKTGQKVLRDSIQLKTKSGGWTVLKADELYTCCTKAYIAAGRDGFDVLAKAKVLVDEDNVPNLTTVIRNSFSLTAIANGFHKPRSPQMLKKLATFREEGLGEREGNLLGVPRKSTDGSGDALQNKYLVACAVEGRITVVEDV